MNRISLPPRPGRNRKRQPVSATHPSTWPFSWPLGVPLLLFLALPVVALLARAEPRQVMVALQEPGVASAVTLSLRTSLFATVATIAAGTPVAYLLARRIMPLHRFVDALIDLPTVLPPAVAGVALLMAFGRRGLVGNLLGDIGIQVVFTPLAVVLAQMFVASPFFLRAAVVGFAAVDPELEQAASLDGASRWQLFTRVSLPLARDALLSGAAMTWARALGEFGATIIFAGNLPGRTQTMPLAIYLGFQINIDAALALSVILLGVSFLVLVVVRGVLTRQ